MKITRRQLKKIISELYKVRDNRVIHYGRDPDELEHKIIRVFISSGHHAVGLAELGLPGGYEEITKLIKDQVAATRKFIETVQWIKERHKNFTPGKYRYKDDSWYDEQTALRETTYKIHPRILELAYGADVGELPKIVDQALAYSDAIMDFKKPEPYMERGWAALKVWAGVS